jgi:copper transport protein
MGRIRAVSRRALVTGLLVCCAVPLWPARPAAAHAVLMHTDPGAGAVLPTAPAEVRLRFSEPVRPVPEQTSVLRPDGGRADTGTPTQNGPSLLIRLATGLSEGTYRVTYRVVSDDGHPVAGGFSFSIGKPSPVSGAGVVAPAGATVDPVVAAIMPIVRYLGFVGLILVPGPRCFSPRCGPGGFAAHPVRCAAVWVRRKRPPRSATSLRVDVPRYS